MRQIRQLIDSIERSPDKALDKKANDFQELEVRELKTQWKHKISVIPESVGITERWWEFTSGVTRNGPEAEIPAGNTIKTTQSGEYIVGVPALAGGASRVSGDAQSSSDDYWMGYTNRIDNADADGAGIGLGHIDGEETEYVWFRSAVDGVPDKKIKREDWNGEDIDDIAENKGQLIKQGGFLRLKYTFYNQGSVKVLWGVKTNEGGIEIRKLHEFNVPKKPMWSQSDLYVAAGVEGSNLTGYLNAAHYKAAESDLTIRENGIGRDGTVYGSDITLNEGQPIPLISIRLREGWENINLQPLGLNVQADGSYYVFIAVDSDLQGANFQPPNSEIPGINPSDSEYAAVADNDATGFNSIGEIEYFDSVGSSGQGSNTTGALSNSIPDFSLTNGKVATLGIIPITASSLEIASLRWGGNF